MEHADQPTEAAGFAPASAIGCAPRARRRLLLIEDVAARHPRPAPAMLEMIEASTEHASLPAPTYSAGFVQTYATAICRAGRRRTVAPVPRQELGRSVQGRHEPRAVRAGRSGARAIAAGWRWWR